MHLPQRLRKNGLLSEADLARLEQVRKAYPEKPLRDVLVDQGFVTDEDLLRTLAEEYGMGVVDLNQVTVDPDLLKKMPARLLHQRTLLPLHRENGTLVVATGDPLDVFALDELQTLTGVTVRPVL